MAAPIAYEQPTVNSAWRAFLDHLPTLALILLCQLGVIIVSVLVLVAVCITAMLLLGTAAGSLDEPSPIIEMIANIGQFPFTVIINLVGVLFMAVPAMHYESGLTITPGMAFGALSRRPARFLLAGMLFALVCSIGLLLCVLPGLAVAMVAPVYVNRIFNTNEPILDAFSRSFQAVYKSEQGMSFVLTELLAYLAAFVVGCCTCGLGFLVSGPVSQFYIQNAAYNKGIIS
jgi:hypothetical protein